MLEVRLLGELEVRRAGRVVPLPASKRSRALLGYLAATARPHLRAQLCDLLWPSPGDPRAALRWSLAKLRAVFGDDAGSCVVADRERVAFEGAGVLVDLAQVRACAEDTDGLVRAAALFRGEFLEGLELPDCHRYHQWCVAERESWRSRRVALLRALVDRLAGSPEQALVHARTWVGVDPLAEDAHAAVMRLLAELGRTREALRQYDACRQILESELAARPSEALERARRALGTPVATAAPSPSAPAAPAAAVALVGRDAERAVIAEHLAGEGPPVLLFLGEAGIGKSRLLEELLAQTRGRVLSGRAFEAEMVRPYGAWIDALRAVPPAAIPAALRPDLSALLPEVASAPAGPADRGRLFDAVAALLRALAQDGPVTVVLDDLHWLDEASAALLHYAARALSDTRVRLGAGARPAELLDNAPVERVVRALRRDGRLREATVGPLSPDETGRLVASLAPGVDAARVWGESQGHPLFALEVTRALSGGEGALSQSLGELIGDRLARLDHGARELLTWSAALGRGFDLPMLAHLLGRPVAEFVGAVEALERHRVLRESGAGYDFVHDLVRQAAYRQTSSARRALVHLRIARALADAAEEDGALAAEVAHHASLGGDHELAARACVRAGERCLRLFAYAEAAALGDRGLPHARQLPREARLALEIGLLRLSITSTVTEARARVVESSLQAIVDEARPAGLEERAQEALSALGYLHWWRGEHALAQQDMLRQERELRDADPAVAARALAMSARCLVHLDRDLPRAERLLHEACSLVRTTGLELLDVPWAQALLHAQAGEYDEAFPLLDRVLALSRAQDDHYAEWDSQARAAMIELERGRPSEALARCRGVAELVSRMPEGSEPAFTAALEAIARLWLGQAGAPAAVAAALDDLRAIDSKWMLAYALTLLAERDLREGRPALARERAGEALEAADAVGRRGEAELARALLAGVALAGGDRDEAGRALSSVRAALGEHRFGARARAAWRSVAEGLGITTEATTVPTTPAD